MHLVQGWVELHLTVYDYEYSNHKRVDYDYIPLEVVDYDYTDHEKADYDYRLLAEIDYNYHYRSVRGKQLSRRSGVGTIFELLCLLHVENIAK